MTSPTEVWKGIDRTAFCENAILLDLSTRSQGKLFQNKMGKSTTQPASMPNDYPHRTEELLDDLALIAAGPGGGDNVTAVCFEVERSEQSLQGFTVRIATNVGTSALLVTDMQQFFDDMKLQLQSGEAHKVILSRIVSRCHPRIWKHVDCLARNSEIMRWSTLEASSPPPFDIHGRHYEHPDDIDLLGMYSQNTHLAFVDRQLNRLQEIATVCQKACYSRASPGTTVHLERLVELAYQIRKSYSARQVIEQSISRLPPKTPNVPTVDEVTQRLGQLAKFARAAHNVAWHAGELANMNINIRFEGTPSVRITIPELSKRSPDDLRVRGGPRFQQSSNQRLKSMLGRWRNYREHAEIQLIIFYEEHPEKTLHSTYIGCDKLSCFLCFHFMNWHGKFYSAGCHQSLYSLWSVRDVVNAQSPATGNEINQALEHLATTMETKIKAQRKKGWRGPRIGTGPESVANLSRTSLAIPRINAQNLIPPGSKEMVAMNAQHQDTVVAQNLSPIAEPPEVAVELNAVEGSSLLHIVDAEPEGVSSPSGTESPALNITNSSEPDLILTTGSGPIVPAFIETSVHAPSEVSRYIQEPESLPDKQAHQHTFLHNMESGESLRDWRPRRKKRPDEDRQQKSKTDRTYDKHHSTRQRARSHTSTLDKIFHVALKIFFGSRLANKMKKSSRSRSRRRSRHA